MNNIIYKDNIGIIFVKNNLLDSKITNKDLLDKIYFCLQNMEILNKFNKNFKNNKQIILDLTNNNIEYYKKCEELYKYRKLIKKYNNYVNIIFNSIKKLQNKIEEISNQKLIKYNKNINNFVKNFKILKTDFGICEPKLNNFEKEIYYMLKKYDFDFIIKQNSINAKRINHLRPDFVIGKKFNDKLKILVIECDGKQHYNKNYFYYNELTLERDKIKENYFKNNNISLFRFTEENYGLLTNLIPKFINSKNILYFGCYYIQNNCKATYNIKVY